MMVEASGKSSVAELSPSKRIEELGRIIMAYSEVTEKLQQSHDKLEQTVRHLRNELSEKNRMLERRNRLAALGEMAAGIAHEIRNPLGGIQLYASLLAKDVADAPKSLELVQKISGGVRRLESLVSQVLQFTREMKAVPVEVEFNELIEQTLEMASARLGERSIEVTVSGERPMPVRVDPLLLGQAVLNLVLNAADAIDGGGRVKISFGREERAGGDGHFWLVIEDNGPGIEPQILDRIFNPFFTTRDTGTGLGLAIVHRVIEAHDGAITASNAEGGGARFEIRI